MFNFLRLFFPHVFPVFFIDHHLRPQNTEEKEPHRKEEDLNNMKKRIAELERIAGIQPPKEKSRGFRAPSRDTFDF